MDHPNETYVAQVTNAALAAVINVYDTGDDGLVEPQGAIEGLCVAISMLAHSTRLSDTPNDRLLLADKCWKFITASQDLIAEAEERGERATPIDAVSVNMSS